MPPGTRSRTPETQSADAGSRSVPRPAAEVWELVLRQAEAGLAAGGMAGLELLSDQGYRVDGRRAGELRKIQARMGVFAQADGSAYIEQGNTKALAVVYGPHEASGRVRADGWGRRPVFRAWFTWTWRCPSLGRCPSSRRSPALSVASQLSTPRAPPGGASPTKSMQRAQSPAATRLPGLAHPAPQTAVLFLIVYLSTGT